MTTDAPIDAIGKSGGGGSVAVAGGHLITIRKPISVEGRVDGGNLTVTSVSGSVALEGALSAKGIFGRGGGVFLNAADSLSIGQNIEAGGSTAGGTVAATGGAVTLTDLSDLKVNGDFGGTMRFSAQGDLTIGGDLDARGKSGGMITGQAGGDLVARGRLRAQSAGCLALAAGGILDTAGGNFDSPIAPACP